MTRLVLLLFFFLLLGFSGVDECFSLLRAESVFGLASVLVHVAPEEGGYDQLARAKHLHARVLFNGHILSVEPGDLGLGVSLDAAREHHPVADVVHVGAIGDHDARLQREQLSAFRELSSAICIVDHSAGSRSLGARGGEAGVHILRGRTRHYES